MSPTIWHDLLTATGETLYMVIVSTALSALAGLPLGVVLFSSARLKPNRILNRLLSSIINISRSVPFIILLVAIIPFTRWLVGTSIGLHAAMVPLTLGAIPFFARLVDNACQGLSQGLIEAGLSMGASTSQIIRRIILPETLPSLIQALTVTAITLVNYSAMAGTVGGGGLGDLAIRYGYQRFNPFVMLITVLVLVVIVQLIQTGGDWATGRILRRRALRKAAY
ncbi:ABC-type metal ion transport system, permease component [Legionella geestiana]|uniref:ABC-type metal ion transport system, permease component n=1 Tax=Legionella geestiana TaxID=45065 RepID=A0A0W0TP72_9GAMM|nr:methionine ABC transporter permease [Legionella geestiana]KTC97392.1 ABC-type metal ion transport system, permease component [Legionella geestiana]QBS11407.1 ABC transporter permease [Legionella geestiana]QDQ38964.1 ABC transporter permease [Legionella geestiana]STX53936.1 DL-methionine transporter subunit; membrane component protein of ABC superfamily [Legionella geestiana]